MRQILRQIVIPDYPDRVLISKARRPVYYVSKDSQVKGKTDVPKSFRDRKKYYFDDRGVLTDAKTGQPKLANSKSVGTPRYWVVNFQQIWNGSIAKHGRSSRVDKLKEALDPYFDTRKTPPLIPPMAPNYQYPVAIEIFIYDTEFPVDVSNRGVLYTKVIEDLLVTKGILIDDSAQYVNDSGRVKYIKIGDKKDKKMIINILSSDNDPTS